MILNSMKGNWLPCRQGSAYSPLTVLTTRQSVIGNVAVKFSICGDVVADIVEKLGFQTPKIVMLLTKHI